MKTLVLVLLIVAVILGVISVIFAAMNKSIILQNISAGDALRATQTVLLFAIALAVYDRAYNQTQ